MWVYSARSLPVAMYRGVASNCIWRFGAAPFWIALPANGALLDIWSKIGGTSLVAQLQISTSRRWKIGETSFVARLQLQYVSWKVFIQEVVCPERCEVASWT